MSNKVLVIGSGGREHAICWKLSHSELVSDIYALPGSFGIGQLNKCSNVNGIDSNDFEGIARWSKSNQIELVVVGPEEPLAKGIADVLKNYGITCFGPCMKGARIESDKKWSKEFMQKYGIPTASFDSFTDAILAKKYIDEAPFNALVVKASGLAAGKGVIVANNISEAYDAVDEILSKKKFGAASETIVIEERLEGEEISVLAFVDKSTIHMMLPAQDHKRLNNGDLGPNTGGMGAYCPCPLISDDELDSVKVDIMQRAVYGLRKEGIDYRGVLYAGLMLTKDGPKVLEFNCRFGDPETEVILPLLRTDLFSILQKCALNCLSEISVEWRRDAYAVGVVMASAGYPSTSTKGCKINGIPANTSNDIVFHSGIIVDADGQYITNGGRVLIVVSIRENFQIAQKDATKTCQCISFSGPGAQFRTDIGEKAFTISQRESAKILASLSYKDSGVDIDAGDDLVKRIKPLSRGTKRTGVMGGLGGFGGLFRLNELNYENPIICEVINGVGTKIKLALEHQMYESIGYDLLAICANDVLESGAEPIGFLDYIACGKLQVPIAAQIIKGMAEGCREAKCALLGGETAEMPTVYAKGKYDLAGYCVGVVEKGRELPQFKSYEEGDLLISLPSRGLHCSGFNAILQSLIELNVDLSAMSEFGDREKTLAQQLGEPTQLYVKEVLSFLKENVVKSIAHISSSLLQDVQRIIPREYEICLDFGDLKVPQIFSWLAVKLKLNPEALLENLNCGIGMVMVVPKKCTAWKTKLTGAKVIGVIKRKTSVGFQKPQIEIRNFAEAIEEEAKKFGRIGEGKLMEPQHRFIQEELIVGAEIRNDSIIAQNRKVLTPIPKEYTDPILIMGTDGVGTKIKIAQQTGKNDTVGIDLVAMCVNDILCNGAEPYTFSTFYACNEFSEDTGREIANGVIKGTSYAGCSLVDLHISEVPLLYKPNVYDLAGFSLGIADFKQTLPRTTDIKVGDIIIGLPSTGVHSNGFSLVHAIMKLKRIAFSDVTPFSNKTFGEEFLRPTKIYVKALLPLVKQGLIKAIAHITGGGLTENIPRILSNELAVQLNANQFVIPPVFGWLASMANIPASEMLRTYNCGLGMVLVIAQEHEKQILEHLQYTERASTVGVVVPRPSLKSSQVVIDNFDRCLQKVKKNIGVPRKRVAVLISGTGSNLQALIEASRDSSQDLHSEIVLVISNKADVLGLKRAQDANIPTLVIAHKEFKTRESFDSELSKHLEKAQIDIICLAGFMRILTEQFVKQWKGRLINIHPSLLPKHPGLHVQKKALDAGDTESGCTIHFVNEGVDTGAIIVQARVPILENDTVEKLTERIQRAEHYAFPKALRLLAIGNVELKDGSAVFEF